MQVTQGCYNEIKANPWQKVMQNEMYRAQYLKLDGELDIT